MIIKNDYIKIQHGKKKIELRNYILTNYLRQFAVYQTDIDYASFTKAINQIFFKFDDTIGTINKDTVLLPSDFDLELDLQPYIVSNIEKNYVVINYDFNVEYSTIEPYIGRKITAIGFKANNYQSIKEKDDRLCAVVDTYNYDIFIQKDCNFNICRQDTIATQGKFWSPSKLIKGPIHLSPNGLDAVIPSLTNDRANAVIYSVGFGTYINRMEYEFIVGEDIGIIVDNYLAGVAENEVFINSFSFTKADDVQLYPNNNIYPLLVTPTSNFGIYPLETNEKLLIIKYKIWQKVYDGNTEEIVDTGLYYHIAIPYDVPYQHNLRIKYERG